MPGLGLNDGSRDCQDYIGVTHAMAWPRQCDGRDGYSVRYDGYTFWLPKAVFERAYLPLGQPFDLTVPESVVIEMIPRVAFEELPDPVSGEPRLTLAVASTRTGFMVTGAEACSNPAHFKSSVGRELAMDAVYEKTHEHLAFVLQWALAGLNALGSDRVKAGTEPDVT